MNSKCSSWQNVISGTPEGSLISPLLFALFVNDFPSLIHTKCLMFADDIKLYSEITELNDTICLQNDLSRLHTWSKTWKLKLNPDKCKSFSITLRRHPIVNCYTIGNTRLQSVETIRDLGVILDTRLTFCHHVDAAVSKANRFTGIIMRSMQTTRKKVSFSWKPILTAYYGNVRAILEYCCVIWGGAAAVHFDKIERAQYRFLRWLYYYVNRQDMTLVTDFPDYSDLLHRFSVTRLDNRRRQYDIMFVSKVFHGKFDSSELLECFPLHVAPKLIRMTEQARGVMHVKYARVDTIKRGMFVRAPSHINDFLFKCSDVDMFHDTLREFRGKLTAYVKQM